MAFLDYLERRLEEVRPQSDIESALDVLRAIERKLRPLKATTGYSSTAFSLWLALSKLLDKWES